MRNSIKDVKDLLVKGEILTAEKSIAVKGGGRTTTTRPK